MSNIYCNDFFNSSRPYPYRSEAEYEAWMDAWGGQAADEYFATHPEATNYRLVRHNEIPDPEDCPCGTYQR
jgi:hypothetical protein